MTCTPAPSCKAALKQATARWPGRRTSSDGICASAQHHVQNPTSDHETGNAFDLSHDPEHGVDTYALADLMRRNPDPRVKYVISNGRIWNPSISPNWRAYHGSNKHDHHMHVSIVPGARGDTGDWWGRYFPTSHAASQEDDMTDADRKMLSEVHDMLTLLTKGAANFGVLPTPVAVSEIHRAVVPQKPKAA